MQRRHKGKPVILPLALPFLLMPCTKPLLKYQYYTSSWQPINTWTQFLKEAPKGYGRPASRENNAGVAPNTGAELHIILRICCTRNRGSAAGRRSGGWTTLKVCILRATRRSFRQAKRA